MSSYELQKLIHHVNRDPGCREKYQKDPGQFTEGYELEPDELQAILSLDIRKLYTFGVHPLLLRPFTLVHGQPLSSEELNNGGSSKSRRNQRSCEETHR